MTYGGGDQVVRAHLGPQRLGNRDVAVLVLVVLHDRD